jgi:hypothetical protein
MRATLFQYDQAIGGYRPWRTVFQSVDLLDPCVPRERLLILHAFFQT